MIPEIKSFYEPDSGTWSYLIADPDSLQAAVIDPVWVYDNVSGQTDRQFVDLILNCARQNNWEIIWVLETHAHADHLSCAALVRAETGAKIAVSRGICDVQKTFARIYHLPELPTDGRQFDRLLVEGDTLGLGEQTISVMEAPGHTADSIVFCIADAAFIGDTLFHPDSGTARCDFPGGSAARLFDSIQRIYALPEETRLFLCHDYPKDGGDPVCCTTVAESKSSNVHLKSTTTKTEFVAMREARDAGLKLPRLIFPSLQINILAGSAPEPEPNGVGYLKIPFNRSIKQLVEPADD